MESNAVPNINLLNFEDAQFEDSKYILTSPRSLEACSRLNLKPVELLTRSLEDFRDELLPRGLSVRAIFEAYSKYEHERQNKLEFCIEERRRVVAENAERECFSQSDEDFQSDEDIQTRGGASVHTQLKSVGRLSERNDRTCKRLQIKTTLDGKKKLGVKKLSDIMRDQSYTKVHSDNPDFHSRLAKITRSAEEKLRTLSRASSGSIISSSEKKNLRPRLKESQSDAGYASGRDACSETGSVTSSVLSSRSCLTDVTLVTDPLLKKKLRGSLNSQTRLRIKDQKILSVMLQKKEQDKEARKRSDRCHSHWEKERIREQRERNAKENQRRLSLAKERNRINELRNEAEAKRLQEEEDRQKERELELDNNYQASSELCKRQQTMKLLKLKERQIQETEKKRSVDLRLELQKKEEEDYQMLLMAKQEAGLRRANSLKLTKEQEQAMRTRIKNKQSKEKHEEKRTAIQQQSLDDLELLQKSLDFQDHVVENQLSRQRWARELGIRQRQKELAKKIEQSRQNQQEIEEEVQNWHRQLANYHLLQEAQAAEMARHAVMKKSEKARQERSQREKMQKEKMKQLLDQEEQWRRDMEVAVEMKKLRIQGILEDRDKMIQESRSLAGASGNLRSRLKQHYSTTDLDDMNRKVQLENKILFRPRTKISVQLKSDNISRLLIG